jgi:uridine kinase
MSQKTMIIGIAGASSSGKTLLANTIVSELSSNQVAVISEDSYYKEHHGLTNEQLEQINYDHPDSLDHALLCDHLRDLMQGKDIAVPIYDFTTHKRLSQVRKVGNHTIIILEGILVFAVPELRDLMDIRIFMETPMDICLLRRLKRDISERGRNIDSVLDQYQTTVRPMFLQFIEPSKRYADIIVPHGGANRIAIDIIKAKMRETIR